MPSKEYYRKNRKSILNRLRERYASDAEFRRKNIASALKAQKNNPEKARKRRAKWRSKNREYINKHHREYIQNSRFSLLAVYSNGQPKCECCNEENIEFLTIDHINGKGVKYGKDKKIKTLYQLFRYLQKNGFPDGYRVLCQNCNSSYGHYGYCPHKAMV